MTVNYTMTVDGDTLRVTASGYAGTRAEAKEYEGLLLAAMRQPGVKRVLCDERYLKYHLDAAYLYQDAAFVAANAPPDVKLAIVHHPDHSQDAQFWEHVARGRGLHVAMFADLESAVDWLDLS